MTADEETPKNASEVHPSETASESTRWLDNPKNVTLLYRGLWVLALALIGTDALYHKHTYLSWEGWFGFYAFYGFLAYVFLVLTAKGMRRLVMREESYYE